ncbi:uncharacterized protein L203_101243 [Cryptococcus depauperatus CBS 7841]|uniref:Uncharacterized protein n=1 Tax=Cryptococcus depauperatus CBS 7841 TaxID=1295531 RepID=A0AAJ8LYU8_9TREE
MAQFFNAAGRIALTNHHCICNVLDHDAKVDNATDITPALTRTYRKCVRVNTPGAVILFPEGACENKSTFYLKHSRTFSFQLDGLIIAHVDGAFS